MPFLCGMVEQFEKMPPAGERLVLRADGNGRIGLGHVMRLLALAEILRTDFAEVVFLIQAPDEALAAMLRSAGVRLLDLPLTSLAEESANTLPDLLRSTDVLVLDGYGFDLAYQAAVRPLVRSSNETP